MGKFRAAMTACLATSLFLLASVLTPRAVNAQELPLCSWPLETSVDSLLNVAYPDTNAIYWTMPLDTSRWSSIIINGKFPESRFMSLTSYDGSASTVDGLLDYQIQPDANSRNPFDPGMAAANGDNSYTVIVDKNQNAPGGGNHLRLSSDQLGFLIYRIYVPDHGQNKQGGVDLPTMTLVALDGSKLTLSPCPKFDLASLPHDYAEALALLVEKIVDDSDLNLGDPAACAPDQVAFAIPKSTGGYFPNPANKYIAAPKLCYQPDRVIVVRGKGAGFPDTYNGAPVWQPAGQFTSVDLRYWSMCNNNQQKPYPVVQCAADFQTGLDSQSYYTYIVAADEAGQRPSWLPAEATWLPWGSQTAANILIFRNMLPSSSFNQSVQDALAAGCTFDNTTGSPPPYTEIAAASACAQTVMGPYRPTAVYCDQDLLIAQGWQACFTAAGVPLP